MRIIKSEHKNTLQITDVKVIETDTNYESLCGIEYTSYKDRPEYLVTINGKLVSDDDILGVSDITDSNKNVFDAVFNLETGYMIEYTDNEEKVWEDQLSFRIDSNDLIKIQELVKRRKLHNE